MISESMKIFVQTGGVMESSDIRYLLNSGKTNEEDIEYLINYIENNKDTKIKPDLDTMVSISNAIITRKYTNLINKIVESEGMWTPYILSSSLIHNSPFPDKLEYYRKYNFQIFYMVSRIKNSLLVSLPTFDGKSYGQLSNLYSRLVIKAYLDDLDYITLNRFDTLVNDLLTFRDKHELARCITNLYRLKDINPRIEEYLIRFIIEFKDPSKRRYYSSAFLKGLYEQFTKKFRLEFHSYMESLCEREIIDIKEFTRYDKAYLTSNDI